MKYSIIIVAYKAEEYLDKCLRSIADSEIEDYEVIIWDNNETGERRLPLSREEWRIYGTGENIGFAAGCNAGAFYAQGEVLIFLNPDTEVSGNWAERLASWLPTSWREASAELDSMKIGAVGPVSDYVAGQQKYQVQYGLVGDPAAVSREHFGRGKETKLLIGFCLVLLRKTWKHLGGMDGNLFLGCDDLDLCWRLKLDGFSLMIALDVFVKHHGNKSFQSRPAIEVQKLEAEGKSYLAQKLVNYYAPKAPPSSEELWGPDFFWVGAEGEYPRGISVCMIARNCKKDLEELLPTLDFADEVVVADTGLEGERMALVVDSAVWERLKLVNFPWTDSFAEARNFALSRCTKGWVIMLDSDDRLPAETLRLLRAWKDGHLAESCKGEMELGNPDRVFCFAIRNVGINADSETFLQIRMFPRERGLRWENRIHETIEHAVDALDLKVVKLPRIEIHHLGYGNNETRLAKALRNLRLLELEPMTPSVLYHMSTCYGILGEHEKSLSCLTRVMEAIHKESDMWKYCAYCVGLEFEKLEAYVPALKWFKASTWPDGNFKAGEICVMMGREGCEGMFEEGAEHLRRYLNDGPRAHYYGTNWGAFSVKAREYLTALDADVEVTEDAGGVSG